MSTPQPCSLTIGWRCTKREGHRRKDITTGSLQEADSGPHLLMAVKDIMSQGKASQRRISQAEAQKQELVMCGTGKQVGSAEEKEKESSKVLKGMRGKPGSKAAELD